MNIVITEAGSAKNVGSMALIENAIKIAQYHFPNCQVSVLCHSPEPVKHALKESDLTKNVEVLHDLLVFPTGQATTTSKIWWILSVLASICWLRFVLLFSNKPSGLIGGQKKQTLRAVEKADLVFCIGAERINDIYFRTAYLSLEVLNIYEKMQKKLVHFSLTIGPIFNKSTIRKAKKVLNNSYAIFVRDSKSYEILKELQVEKPFKFSSYDVAIFQTPCRTETTNAILKEYNIDLNKPFVGVSVIHWLFKKTEGSSKDPEYIASFAQTLDYIVEKLGYNVVFIPTVIDKNNSMDDVMKSQQIIDNMKNKKAAVVIDKLLTPSQLAGVYSASRYSIVTRMHAAILCSGAGQKPVIAVNYLYKLREYMKNIGFEDYSVDIDRVTPEELTQFVVAMENNYEDNCQKLQVRMNELKSVLNANIESIKKNI